MNGAPNVWNGLYGPPADIESISHAADATAAVTTVSGATTLIVTGGNVDAASHAASIKDIVITAGTAGLAGEGFNLGDSLGLADDVNDLSGSSNPSNNSRFMLPKHKG